MAKRALVLVGGWEGHEPVLVGERFSNFLKAEGFAVEVREDLEILGSSAFCVVKRV